MRISDWSSDVCSSDLDDALDPARLGCLHLPRIEKASQDACDLLDLALLAADEMADACHYDFARVNVVRGGGLGKLAQRSEERGVGEECVSRCRSRWSPYD